MKLIRHNGKRYSCVPCGVPCWRKHIRGRLIMTCPKCGAVAAIPLRRNVFGQYPYCKTQKGEKGGRRVRASETEKDHTRTPESIRQAYPKWFETGESG